MTSPEAVMCKRMIRRLDSFRGSGTSIISLIIPPNEQISRYTKMLDDEQGTATNIKSRVNRLSVLSAIASTRQILKQYNRIPKNGLCVFCGEVANEEGKIRKEKFHFEPFKPIKKSLYECGPIFATESLKELLQSDEVFGFIVMDGSGTLFGTLCGDNKTILNKITVEIPRKHGRGGQSAQRFGRIRQEKRHNYVRKVAELAKTYFLTDDRPNIEGIILAGSADFKSELSRSDLFDSRLSSIVLKLVDISYGMEQGFNQAIDRSAEALAEVVYVREKKILHDFFQEIALETGKYAYGINDVFSALDMSCVQTIIIWEHLEHNRYVIRDPSTEVTQVLILDPKKQNVPLLLKQAITPGYDPEIISCEPVIEYLVEAHKTTGAKLLVISNRSQEGDQFVKGFGGIGAVLFWKVDFELIETALESGSDSDDESSGSEFDEDEFDSDDDFM